ncbi:MAG: putative zinc-binding metallopeptidase [Pseudomonadota bacterium]
MKTFSCACGNRLFFENTVCMSCNKKLGYSFETDTMEALEEKDNSFRLASNHNPVRLCKNYSDYNVCNALIPYDSDSDLCISCQLNRTIPNLEFKDNIKKWGRLEKAKRRLVRSLLILGLPVIPHTKSASGLAFDFIEDQQQNPQVLNEFVSTGHFQGLITINLAEADDIFIENAKNDLGEQYRTPLGHLRHESGHYYFDLLINNSEWIDKFRAVFGNEQQDYTASLEQYYQTKPHNDWNQYFISEYAMVHPVEDWAECWAHYLHMIDTLETARSLNVLVDKGQLTLQKQLTHWAYLSMSLNELNRSMGLNDAYPFVMSEEVIRKIDLVDRVIDPSFAPIQQVGAG